jgi:hypothetical protein
MLGIVELVDDAGVRRLDRLHEHNGVRHAVGIGGRLAE